MLGWPDYLKALCGSLKLITLQIGNWDSLLPLDNQPEAGTACNLLSFFQNNYYIPSDKKAVVFLHSLLQASVCQAKRELRKELV